jgi:alkanesulfonate monooxygenase SsuD/methylene tetrahydromethanopterin reductase-like flavin-dependent oxidoreductase (luciferase family)
MLASLDRAATSAGREPDAITRVYNVTVELDGEANDDPYRVVGSSDAVAERLAGFLDLGFDALNLIPVGDQSPDQLARIGNEVLPTLRAART